VNKEHFSFSPISLMKQFFKQDILTEKIQPNCMKRKPLVLLFVCLLLLSTTPSVSTVKATSAAPELQWSKTYGYIAAYGITQTSDGNLLVAAQKADSYDYTGHLGFSYNNVVGILMKIDTEGNVLSNKTLHILPKVMQSTGDGDLIIAGDYTKFYGYSSTDMAEFKISQYFASLAKMSQDGESVWTRSYNLPGQPMTKLNETTFGAWSVGAHVTFLLQLNDGGYLLGGTSNLGGSLSSPVVNHAWLIRTNSSGDSLWVKTYGFTSVKSVVQSADGGFLLVGDEAGYVLVKVDGSGNIEWSKETGDFGYAVFNSIIQTEDGCLLVGYQDSEPFLLKIDKNFNQIWNKTFTSENFGTAMLQNDVEKNYLFTTVGGLLVKTDFDGDILWTCAYNGAINCLTSTNDGGYVFAGKLSSNSMIQTTSILIGKLSGSNANPSPSVPELNITWLVLLVLSISMILAVVKALKIRKNCLPTRL
jgi:hypothetical protein